nr:MAG TPA: hypothetical protein [Caudoviricetes sp.]
MKTVLYNSLSDCPSDLISIFSKFWYKNKHKKRVAY